MPFITEEIWQTLPHDGDTIMMSKWPEYDEKLGFPAEEESIERVMAAIKSIRNRRAEMNVPPSKKTHVYIETAFKASFEAAIPFIMRLAFASTVEIGEKFDIEDSVRIVAEGALIFIPMGELVDTQKEIARLEKERLGCIKQLEQVILKLSNDGFLSKAPANVVDAEKERAEKLSEKAESFAQSIAALKNKQNKRSL